ncbi:MAG: glycosyltransferase [Candidatus Lernaella stagnicola]|nr:glycosyltransferase [Candidatus Lernaella stagnicola]
MKRLVLTVTRNEAPNISAMIAAVRDRGFDLLVVDDKGSDNTADLVRAAAATDPHVHLIAREGSPGYAAASRDGFAWALAERYEQVCQLDADGSHAPDRLGVMFRALDEVDVAIGSRYVFGGSLEGLRPARRWLSRMAGAFVRSRLGVPVADPTSGYRAWRTEFLGRVLPLAQEASGFAFLYEMLFHAVALGGRVREIPIVFAKRRAGESKMSWSITRDALRVVRRLRKSR